MNQIEKEDCSPYKLHVQKPQTPEIPRKRKWKWELKKAEII